MSDILAPTAERRVRVHRLALPELACAVA
jgi:hypothetical protein